MLRNPIDEPKEFMYKRKKTSQLYKLTSVQKQKPGLENGNAYQKMCASPSYKEVANHMSTMYSDDDEVVCDGTILVLRVEKMVGNISSGGENF